jgi:hypothetical protein
MPPLATSSEIRGSIGLTPRQWLFVDRARLLLPNHRAFVNAELGRFLFEVVQSFEAASGSAARLSPESSAFTAIAGALACCNLARSSPYAETDPRCCRSWRRSRPAIGSSQSHTSRASLSIEPGEVDKLDDCATSLRARLHGYGFHSSPTLRASAAAITASSSRIPPPDSSTGQPERSPRRRGRAYCSGLCASRQRLLRQVPKGRFAPVVNVHSTLSAPAP